MNTGIKLLGAFAALGLVFGGISVATMAPTPAVAQSNSAKLVTDRAKADGIVGERIDGYLGLVQNSASGDIQAAVNEINIRRKSAYTDLARNQNVSVDVVAKLSGEKLTANAPRGQMVLLDASGWKKK